MKRNEMPIGFIMALSENPEAMKKFALLSEDKKHAFAEGAHPVRSQGEMNRYVSSLVTPSE